MAQVKKTEIRNKVLARIIKMSVHEMMIPSNGFAFTNWHPVGAAVLNDLFASQQERDMCLSGMVTDGLLHRGYKANQFKLK